MAKIGIDFGTTNSLIVAYDKEINKFSYFNYDFLNATRPVPTSSTVWYHDGAIEVGQKARENIHRFSGIEGHHFEKSIKLKLGTKHHLNIFGSPVEPYKVAGTILSSIKKHAEVDSGADLSNIDMNQAVFTVPINFSGEARRDLRKSANEAGIEVTTFIHEPFAAVVGYIFTKYSGVKCDKPIEKMQNLDGEYLMTFDWGGGTLDITVVQVKDGKMIELGTSELTNVAGDWFDEIIATYAWNSFLDDYGSKYSMEYLDLVKKRVWGKMLAYAEKCKLELSEMEETEFLLERVDGSDDDIYLSITREKFEELISPSIDAASVKIDEAIAQAGIQDIDISHVLLTGGTCYIPAVKNRMIEKFGQRVEEVKDADLVIAQGAAVIAEMGWLPFLTKDIQIELSDGAYWPIFEKGMPIAANGLAHNEEEFSCVDSRLKRAKIIVGEGCGTKKDKNLAILNVPVLGDYRFGDDIVVEASLDRDIVLTIKGHSKMVVGYEKDENYAIRKTAEVVQLCFGLDFTR